ncbi:MAG: hypothetical protein WD772_05375, partial [Pseudohongiellaceae bacterium]
MKHRIHRALSLVGIVLALSMGAKVFAQADIGNVLENIRPVGQVCIAGQDCNGSGGVAPSAAPVVESAPAEVPVTEVAVTDTVAIPAVTETVVTPA